MRGSKLVLGGAMLWLVTLCFQPFSEAWQLYRQVQEKEMQILTAVRYVLPTIPDNVRPVSWLTANLQKNDDKKLAGSLTNILLKNREFMNSLEQGYVQGLTWSSENNTLTFNVFEASDKLAAFATQFSGKDRTITLYKKKGSKATKVVIQENEQ